MDVVTKPRLLDEVRQVLRRHHYSLRTEKSYLYWIRFYIRFAGRRHPRELGPEEVERFLTWRATVRRVAASTQNQALSALLFLYQRVLRLEFPRLGKFERAKQPVHLPTVLTCDEVRSVFAHLDGSVLLIARLLYGGGLRLLEALRLRVKDLDFEQRQLMIRDGKGAKDRVTMLPESVIPALKVHLEKVRVLYEHELVKGTADVWLPYALARKYPRAAQEWGWQFVFPARERSRDPETGAVRRHHIHEKTMQRAIKMAVQRAEFVKPEFSVQARGRCHGLKISSRNLPFVKLCELDLSGDATLAKHVAAGL